MEATTSTTTAAAINWVKSKVTGDYKSECGRFHIYQSTACANVKKWGKWVVYDRHTKDVVTPEFNVHARKQTLAACKSQAQRWLAGKRW